MTGKEFGLGRDRRIAITEAIQANIELFSGHKHKPLTARINSDNSVTLHSWLDRYEKILASRGIKQKTLINYMSKIKAIRRVCLMLHLKTSPQKKLRQCSMDT